MIPTDDLSTQHYVTASEGANIDRGEVYEFNLPADSGELIETTAPVMVAQYLVGGQGTNTDPAIAIVPGASSWLDDYRLATPDGSLSFNENYASIVIDSTSLGSLMLDGAMVDTSGFNPIDATGFSQGLVDLPLGLFDLSADSEFLVMLGGASNADSYFTYGGATFSTGISPPVVTPPTVPVTPPVPPPTTVNSPASLGLLGMAL
jgi:hypothetical protein